MPAYRPRVMMGPKPRIGPTDKSAINSRSPDSARRIRFSTGVTSQASGSAMFEQGNTKIVCSVYGPKAIRRNSEISEDGIVQCHVKLAPFSMYKRQLTNNRNNSFQNEDFRIKMESSLSSSLLRAIQGSIITDQFPKSVLEIHALVLSDDGGVHAGLVSCATMALANSGVALYDLVPCCSVGLVDDGNTGNLVFDAEQDTAYNTISTLDLALMPASENVTDMNVNGVMTFETAGEAVSLCFAGCMLIYKQMREHLIADAKLRLTNN